MVGNVQSFRQYPQDQQQPHEPLEQQQQPRDQNYQEIEFLKSANEKINKVKLATLNVANLLSKKKYKINHLEALLREEDIKVLCLQETWLDDEILEAETHIEGYINYRQDRGGDRKGGGTST